MDTHYVLCQNAALCEVCKDYIVSKTRHDYVSCSCGAVAVDGGLYYQRVIGELEYAKKATIHRPLPPINDYETGDTVSIRYSKVPIIHHFECRKEEDTQEKYWKLLYRQLIQEKE